MKLLRIRVCQCGWHARARILLVSIVIVVTFGYTYLQNALISRTANEPKIGFNRNVLSIITDPSLPTSVMSTTQTPSIRGKADLCKPHGPRPAGDWPLLQDRDILKLGPFKFLPNYKNPCWMDPPPTSAKGLSASKNWSAKLRCMPYFFIIGMPKCGTTDLWQKLIRHPDVHPGMGKEPMWFNRRRFDRRLPFSRYVRFFDQAGRIIERKMKIWGDIPYYHHMITGEGTVDIGFDNAHWPSLPGNENCSEPRFTNPDFLHHLFPGMKLIMVLRNPIDRVFSDYLYESNFLRYNKTLDDFHEAVLDSIDENRDCLKHFTERACAYNMSIETFKARLRIGMYSVYLEDWLRLFPREQILILRFEDLKRDPPKIYREVYHFLGLRQLTVDVEEEVFKGVPNQRSKKDRALGDMWPETRQILQEYYWTYNARLAALLQDDRYLEWQFKK